MPLAPGQDAPAAAVLEPDGARRELAPLWAGGPALVFFYKGDCPASPLGAAVLPRLAAAVPGLRVIAVAQDDAVSARDFAAAHGWGAGVEVLVDPEPWPASDAFAVRSTPTWVLVGAGGKVEVVAEGWSRDDANALAARAAALVGAPPQALSSPAEGGPALRPG